MEMPKLIDVKYIRSLPLEEYPLHCADYSHDSGEDERFLPLGAVISGIKYAEKRTDTCHVEINNRADLQEIEERFIKWDEERDHDMYVDMEPGLILEEMIQLLLAKGYVDVNDAELEN